MNHLPACLVRYPAECYYLGSRDSWSRYYFGGALMHHFGGGAKLRGTLDGGTVPVVTCTVIEEV